MKRGLYDGQGFHDDIPKALLFEMDFEMRKQGFWFKAQTKKGEKKRPSIWDCEKKEVRSW